MPSHHDERRRILTAVMGGNSACHCVHDSELLDSVAAVELQGAATERGGQQSLHGPTGSAGVVGKGTDPWQPGHSGQSHRSGGDGGANSGTATGVGSRPTLPLRPEKPVGALLHKDRSPFDDKLTTRQEYLFDGVTG